MTWFVTFSRFARRAMAALVLPAWLAGCAVLEGPTATVPVPAAESARPYREVIDIGGRLSVRYQQNGAEQALHGSFSWVQSPESTTVTLLSPLGQIIAMINVTPGTSTLTLAGQAPRSAADVDTLAAAALGWPLPISGLRDWLQGYGFDSEGRRFVATPPAGANLVTRDGWRLAYAGWRNEADRSAQNHPRRIDLERDTGQAGNVAIRIVIDDWHPH
jgi:outer membrane lipoprotein LolB